MTQTFVLGGPLWGPALDVCDLFCFWPLSQTILCHIVTENIFCVFFFFKKKQVSSCLFSACSRFKSNVLFYTKCYLTGQFIVRTQFTATRFVIKAYYQRQNKARWWERCHQQRCFPPFLQLWPLKWLGGHSARSCGSAPAATHPPGFLTFATPTGKTGGWFRLHNEDVRRFMQHCGVRRNCTAHSQHSLDLCYFAISISQLCEQEQLNISQSKPKLQTVKVYRLYSHWLRIWFELYHCFVPGISCLQEHPEGANGGPEHVVPKCEAVPIAATRRQKRSLQMGHVSCHTGWRTVDVEIFTCRISIVVCCSVCLRRFWWMEEVCTEVCTT